VVLANAMASNGLEPPVSTGLQLRSKRPRSERSQVVGAGAQKEIPASEWNGFASPGSKDQAGLDFTGNRLGVDMIERGVSINLKREPSLGPMALAQQPNLFPHVVPRPMHTDARPAATRVESRDPATEAALTLTDCFLRRESSLEKLGLLNVKRNTSMDPWKSLVETGPEVAAMPPPTHEPPAVVRQSSLASLASIAELTSTKNEARNIFGNTKDDGAAGELLERNLSLVFQSQDSDRHLLMRPEGTSIDVQPRDDSSEDDSDDEGGTNKKMFEPAQNSYEFFARNTPQQLYGNIAPTGPTEGVEGLDADPFVPSFQDLAAACLKQDKKGGAAVSNGTNARQQKTATAAGQNGTGWLTSNAVVVPGTGAAASPMNVHQNNTAEPDEKPKYIGRLTVEERKRRVQRYLDKKKRRVWGRKVEYQCRKNLASKRARVHGRFA